MTMNYSEEERRSLYARSSPLENILFASFYILVFVIAVPANTVALWAFCKKSNSPSRIFLSNLAIADVSYVLVLPLRMVHHLSNSHWPFDQVLCRLLGYLFHLNMYCSLYFMTCVSLDRLLILVFQVRSQSIRKALYARVAAVIIWITITVSMCPVLLSKKPVTIEVDNVTTCNQLYLENPSPKALVSTVVAFVIPLFIVAISYVLILIKLRKVKHNKARLVRKKAVRMIILIIVNFLVAFLPYHVSRVIYIGRSGQTHMTETSIKTLSRANRITSAMTCVSGVLDPILYFFLDRNYHNMLLELICKNRKTTT